MIACPYAAHHFSSTNFSDQALTTALLGGSTLAPVTGLQSFGSGGLLLNAPLGSVGWSVALTVGFSSSASSQTVLQMNGLNLVLRNGTFIFA